MDNVAFHRTQIVRDELAILGFEEKFLPPYSPFFNPIENMFAQWKQFVRTQQPTTEDELRLALDEVRNVVTLQDCANYVANTNNNCLLCTQATDVFEN